MPDVALGAVIAAQVAEWEVDDLPIERALFGTVDPEAIAAAVDGWCGAHLGAGVAHYEFFASSSGSVHGVVLTDGRAVVVKGHRPGVGRRYLDAVIAVQHALADTGYPAPRPLAGPVAFGAGLFTAETTLPRRDPIDAHDPSVRFLLAHGLARFIELARGSASHFAGVEHPLTVRPGDLYPQPHSPRFDFAATVAGAEWIDALAARARQHLAAGADVGRTVVHGDWRIENLSVDAGGLAGVYDWDSVQVAPEPAAVATAACTFCVDWRPPPRRRFPSPPEIALFVHDYENARARAFSAAERDHLAAAMVAALAYGARCEHSIPANAPPLADSQRGLLRALGAALLDDGLEALDRPGPSRA